MNDWNPSLYTQKHSFVFRYGEEVLSLLDPQPQERILDLGCGTGQLTNMIADAGAKVVGVDSSVRMVEAARAAYPNGKFQVADARNFSFAEPFDAVFSNAALHWVVEAEQAASCIAAALKPGGRFVAELGGKGNISQIRNAVQEAFRDLTGVMVEHGRYYPSIGEYAMVLEKSGLSVKSALLFDRSTKLEDGEKGLRNWIETFDTAILRSFSEIIKQQMLQKVESKLRGTLFRDGSWFADYKRLRIVAYKE